MDKLKDHALTSNPALYLQLAPGHDPFFTRSSHTRSTWTRSGLLGLAMSFS